jgi:hypothetical protein
MRRTFLTYLAVATATAACDREHAVSRREASARPLAQDAASTLPGRGPPIAVVQALLPLLDDRIAAYADEFDSAGRSRGPSPRTPSYEAHLASLLQRRDSIGDQALAILQGVYLGERHAETLECEIQNRGLRMLPLLERYRPQPPSRWFPQLPAKLVLDSTYYDDVIVRVRQAVACEYEK